MKITRILLGCFLIVGFMVSQGNAFEITNGGNGLTQYRFNQNDLVYKGNKNIDITSMLAKNGINQKGLNLDRVKLIINGKVTATFQTYGDKGFTTLGALKVSSKGIFFAQNFPTLNRGWNIVLTHPKRYAFKGLHVTVR